MNRTLELLWIKIREYFKHPVDDLRQAKVIVPGRVYSNFGHLCKAVPYTDDEKAIVDNDNFFENGLSQDVMLEQVKSIGLKNVEAIKAMQAEANNCQGTPFKCTICDFQKECIPCPIFNKLKNGQMVCEVYKYVIIKKARK